MKKILATLALVLGISSLWAPLSFAKVEYQGFDVFEILDVEGEEGENTSFSETIRGLDADGGGAEAPDGGSVAASIILRAINILTLLVGTFAFVMIVIGGFMMITANGDESKVDRGKNILTQTVIGVVIAFLAYFIVVFVQSLFY